MILYIYLREVYKLYGTLGPTLLSFSFRSSEVINMCARLVKRTTKPTIYLYFSSTHRIPRRQSPYAMSLGSFPFSIMPWAVHFMSYIPLGKGHLTMSCPEYHNIWNLRTCRNTTTCDEISPYSDLRVESHKDLLCIVIISSVGW